MKYGVADKKKFKEHLDTLSTNEVLQMLTDTTFSIGKEEDAIQAAQDQLKPLLSVKSALIHYLNHEEL